MFKDQAVRLFFLGFLLFATSSHADYSSSQVNVSVYDDSSLQNEVFDIGRAKIPSKELVDQQSMQADQRVFKKYLVASSVAVSAIVLLMISYEIRQAASARKAELAELSQRAKMQEVIADFLSKRQLVSVPKVSQDLNLSPSLGGQRASSPTKFQGWGSWVYSGITSFGWDCSEFVATSAQMLVSGVVVNGMYNYLHNKVKQVYSDESVIWYLQEHTKIKVLVNDLKVYAVDYDVYASLLSSEVFNQDAQMHMKAFVTDLLGSAQEHMHNEIFKDPQYFNFLLGDIKKKYARQSAELENLQEYVVPNIAKQHRATAGQHEQALFANDMNRRRDIAQMCTQLAHEVEQLTAFVMMHGDRYSSRVRDIIDSCNAFLAHMEMLLNASAEKIQEYSKADQGMFTSVYEYDKLLHEQVQYIHRYCKTVK